ncbi:MAG TPA: SMC-Scp complex subunit ScpB [Bryobacteraceae bacterium]
MDEADVKPTGEEPAVEAESTQSGPEGAAPPETADPRESAREAPETVPPPAGEEPLAADRVEAEANAEAPVQAGEPAEAAPEPAAIAEEEIDEPALKAVIEAIVYVSGDPVAPQQIAAALQKPEAVVQRLFEELVADCAQPHRGIMIREVAGGYRMGTKPEHHEGVRAFAKSLNPPLKLSLAALETLATIAYKQPITAPEIMEIRGVQGAGVLKTLLDRKLIQTSGRKNVVGRPILYRTSKDFLVQFGLKDLAELPTLKEFEELRRLAVSEDEPAADAQAAPAAPPAEPEGEAPEAAPAVREEAERPRDAEAPQADEAANEPGEPAAEPVEAEKDA